MVFTYGCGREQNQWLQKVQVHRWLFDDNDNAAVGHNVMEGGKHKTLYLTNYFKLVNLRKLHPQKNEWTFWVETQKGPSTKIRKK